MMFNVMVVYVTLYSKRDSHQKITAQLMQIHNTEIVCLKPLFKRHFDVAYAQTRTSVSALTGVLFFALIAMLLFSAGIQAVVDTSPFPLPIYYEILVLPVVGWRSYIMNFVVQTLICTAVVLMYQSLGNYFFWFAFCLMAKMEVTLVIIREMKWIRSELGSVNNWIRCVIESINDCKR